MDLPSKVIEQGQYMRLLSGPLEHSSHVHFGYCLLSLFIKGYQIEWCRSEQWHHHSRSVYFLGVFAVALVGVPLTYVAAAWLWVAYSDDNYPTYADCHQGMSAVLFALKPLCLWQNANLW